MTARFILRPQADRDIDEIADCIAQTNPKAGLRFLEEVYATIEKLAESPGLGSP